MSAAFWFAIAAVFIGSGVAFFAAAQAKKKQDDDAR